MSTIAIKEKPILFSTSLIPPILDGTKTVTRRVVKGCVEEAGEYSEKRWMLGHMPKCPYGEAGGHLWVRETHVISVEEKPVTGRPCKKIEGDSDDCSQEWEPNLEFGDYWVPYYKATDRDMGWRKIDSDEDGDNTQWSPSIHMPRWASRITLEIVSIRVEKLQDISGPDVEREGFRHSLRCRESTKYEILKERFAEKWDELNKERGYSWESNPFVWRIEFKKV